MHAFASFGAKSVHDITDPDLIDEELLEEVIGMSPVHIQALTALRAEFMYAAAGAGTDILQRLDQQRDAILHQGAEEKEGKNEEAGIRLLSQREGFLRRGNAGTIHVDADEEASNLTLRQRLALRRGSARDLPLTATIRAKAGSLPQGTATEELEGAKAFAASRRLSQREGFLRRGGGASKIAVATVSAAVGESSGLSLRERLALRRGSSRDVSVEAASIHKKGSNMEPAAVKVSRRRSSAALGQMLLKANISTEE